MATQIEKVKMLALICNLFGAQTIFEMDKKEIISVHMVYATRVVQVHTKWFSKFTSVSQKQPHLTRGVRLEKE